jgi:hypothetical protein
VPIAELLCVALGALIPCLLGYCVIRTLWQRAAFSAAIIAVGIAASALSAALSYGPDHAWAWLDLPVQVGIGFAALLAAGAVARAAPRARRRWRCWRWRFTWGCSTRRPPTRTFAQTLQTWEQGRFIRFHGVVQWLGWLWPYAALLYVLVRLSGREPR